MTIDDVYKCLSYDDEDFYIDIDSVYMYGEAYELGGTYTWKYNEDDEVDLARALWDFNDDNYILVSSVKSASDRDYRTSIFWSTGGKWKFGYRDSEGMTRELFMNSNCEMSEGVPTAGWEPVNEDVDYTTLPIVSYD